MYLRDNTQDAHVLSEVYCENEYRLPDSFDRDDVIIDVGAHIGCFALACLHRGAGKVVCYEPESSNFELLYENLKPYQGRVEAHRMAVWKSGVQEAVRLVLSKPNYTAMHRATSAKAVGVEVPSRALDVILRGYSRVRLLKLDCEYSEYPILRTSKELHRVQEIVGEAHLGASSENGVRLDGDTIAELLRGQGFKTLVVPHNRAPEALSWFFAKR